MGVSVEKVKIGVFTLAGFLFGVAGVIGAIRLGQGQIAIGDDKMFPPRRPWWSAALRWPAARGGGGQHHCWRADL